MINVINRFFKSEELKNDNPSKRGWRNFNDEIPNDYDYSPLYDSVYYWVMTKNNYGYTITVASFSNGQFEYPYSSSTVNDVVMWYPIIRPKAPTKIK